MCFYDILERKKVFLCCKNKKFKNLKNWDFSKGVSPWFWLKIGYFLHVFISRNIGQENVLHYVLERKNISLGYENKKFKKTKNWDFFKGVSLWFWSKIGHFCMFLFLAREARKMCFAMF